MLQDKGPVAFMLCSLGIRVAELSLNALLSFFPLGAGWTRGASRLTRVIACNDDLSPISTRAPETELSPGIRFVTGLKKSEGSGIVYLALRLDDTRFSLPLSSTCL